jgi:hypothetical protein
MVRKTSVQGGGGQDDLRDEEHKQLSNDLKRLRRDKLMKFALDAGLDPATKEKRPDLAERIVDALKAGRLHLRELMRFLDQAAEWDKQHVILLGAPTTGAGLNPRNWQKEDWLRKHLTEHSVVSLLGKRKPLVLPEKMTLASIELDPLHGLRVMAVMRCQGSERDEREDDDGVRESDGAEIEYRAFVKVITRGLVMFEWNLKTNEAMMRIRQLPGGLKYEDVFATFKTLVKSWLPIDHFPLVTLGAALLNLRELAKDEDEGIRAHVVDLAAHDGRRVIGRSQHADQRLDGNDDIDGAMDKVAEDGSGYAGNFFFEPAANDNGSVADSDDEEDEDDEDDAAAARRRRRNDAHVVLQANKKNRINFMTPQTETVIRNVLQRIRSAC